MPKKTTTKNSSPRKRGRPPRLDNLEAHWQRAWELVKDVNSHYSMRPSEQQTLFNQAMGLAKKPVIVELGVTHGKTALLLAYVANLLDGSYTGVDNFKLEGSAKEVRVTLKKNGLQGTILEGNTVDVPWKGVIDLLHIDAGHDRINMMHDCNRWLPHIAPGGLVAFHDYNPDIDQQDPHFFIKYFANFHTKHWNTAAYDPYILIRRKPKKP
jgi:predicted O-methyltransferase YrrM